MQGFIIYPTYEVQDGKAYVYLYGRLKNNKSFLTKSYFRPYFFIREKDLKKATELETFDFEKTSLKNFKHELLTKVILDVPSEVPELRKLFEDNFIECFEADVRFEYRFLIDNNLKGSIEIKGSAEEHQRVDLYFDEPEISSSNEKFTSKDFKILSLDIETSRDAKKIYCISLKSFDNKLNKVLIVANEQYKNADSFKTQKDMLEAFRKEIINYDPDILVGWNLIDFDLKILKEHMSKFDLGRSAKDCTLRLSSDFLTDSKADFNGREVLDGIHVLKSSFISLDDYKLNTAAAAFTDEEKLIGDENKSGEIDDAYDNNKQKLIDYNLLDSKLVLDILKNSKTLDLTILRSSLTGMPLQRVRASIASMDSLYLSELRKKGFVAGSRSFVKNPRRTTGGFVMSSKPGIYSFVAVFDFKSLYPSIMRTFNIDPLLFRKNCEPIGKEELLKAPNGVCFSKSSGILPKILENLAIERQKATENKDEVTRGAIKILMNSLYGVLASPNCRFYSFEMANAITGFGHMIIKNSIKYLEQKGFEVVYGDTDSYFVNLNVKTQQEALKICNDIQRDVNEYFEEVVKKEYGMKNSLELEFEKLFLKFFMPKVRSKDVGAKKRYAGLIKKNGEEKIDFTGLEFVRRDWTDVSKKFQLELLNKVFKEEKIEDYIKDFTSDLKKGKYDDLLVYRKALRKKLSSYTKTTPPHVKAARKLDELKSNIIDYVITINGPEPIQKISSTIDYDHYIEKQIKPLANSVLTFFDKEFEDVFRAKQTDLFNF